MSICKTVFVTSAVISKKISTFVPAMKLDLYINEANDYARDIRVPLLHPHVAIIHYDEAGEIRHSLNRIDCYGIFLQREFPENLTYGIGTYHDGDGSLIAFAPGQIGGKRDDGTRRQYHGWVLLFDPVFIHGTKIEQRMKDYHFFSYNNNEALFLNTEEKDTLAGLMSNIRRELTNDADDVQDDIVRDYIQLILDYCNRFYARQFKEMTAGSSDETQAQTTKGETMTTKIYITIAGRTEAYTLQGTLAQARHKGIVIQNGNKVAIK